MNVSVPGSQKCFDPLVDYTSSILDVPHRVILAPIMRIPSPAAKTGLANWLGAGWTAAAIFNLQSGYPIRVSQSNSTSNLLGNGQRPNLVPGVDLATAGDQAERLASADHPAAAWPTPRPSAPRPTTRSAMRRASSPTSGRRFRPKPICRLRRTSAWRAASRSRSRLRSSTSSIRSRSGATRWNTTQGNSAFGTVVSQRGFMRTTQIMFRYSC